MPSAKAVSADPLVGDLRRAGLLPLLVLHYSSQEPMYGNRLIERIEQLTDEGLGVLAITHYRRLFTELRPDVVHVLVAGRIERSGGPEVAEELEASGYGPEA